MFCDPLRAGVQILAMLRLRGNAWETDIFTELIDEPGLVLLQIINDSLHHNLCSRETRGSKANLGACQSADTSPFAPFPFVLVVVVVLLIDPFIPLPSFLLPLTGVRPSSAKCAASYQPEPPSSLQASASDLPSPISDLLTPSPTKHKQPPPR